MKLLKQKTSGELYVWSEDLAKRDDMEEFVKEVPVEVAPVEQADQEVVEEVVAVTAPKAPIKKGKK